MKNKGFTLIELLAVILILGIIALIAIPTVTTIISDARKGSFKSTVQSITSAVENKCQLQQLKGEEITKNYHIEDGEFLEDLDIKGNLPDSGNISVNDECEIGFTLNTNDFVATKEQTSEEIFVSLAGKTGVYLPGTSVTYNPGDSTYSNWYVLKDNGDTVTLLLNRSLGSGGDYVCAWASAGDYASAGGTDGIYSNLGPLTVTKKIQTLTSSWKTEAKENIRLITIEEIMEIIGVSEITTTILYFDTKSEVAPTEKKTSKYAWLFNNISGCLEYGCSEDTITDSFAYWTNSKVEGKDMVYVVDEMGSVYQTINTETIIVNGEIVGWKSSQNMIRPVITIPKASIK